MVGCDGAHSTVRKQLGLAFEGRPEDDMWMVGDVVIRGPLPEDEIFVYLAEEGTMALFPLGNHHYRVAAIAGPDHDPDSQAPTPEAFESAILKRGPAGLNVSQAKNLWYFRIHERQVPQYQVGRVFLMGDAAHIHSPMGGQGMNTGIQDAFNLAWKLALVIRGQAGEKLLESYNIERHPVAEKVIRGTALGTHAMTLKSTVGQHIRNRVMGLVSKLPLFQSRVPRVAAEIDIHYRNSPLSVEPHSLPHGWLFHGGVPSGNRAPNAVLYRGADHQAISLFELLREPHFQLLLLSGISPDPDYGRLKAIAQWVGEHHQDMVTPHIVCAHPDAPSDLPGQLHDPQHDLHHQHGRPRNPGSVATRRSRGPPQPTGRPGRPPAVLPARSTVARQPSRGRKLVHSQGGRLAATARAKGDDLGRVGPDGRSGGAPGQKL